MKFLLCLSPSFPHSVNFINFRILTVIKTKVQISPYCHWELANKTQYTCTYVLCDVHRPDDGRL
jgi:hypothetical protein